MLNLIRMLALETIETDNTRRRTILTTSLSSLTKSQPYTVNLAPHFTQWLLFSVMLATSELHELQRLITRLCKLSLPKTVRTSSKSPYWKRAVPLAPETIYDRGLASLWRNRSKGFPSSIASMSSIPTPCDALETSAITKFAARTFRISL